MTPAQQAALDEELALEEEVALERARTGMLAFAVHTMPSYEVNFHHRLIAQKLDAFLAGDILRLMVFLPPRMGKTQLCSIHLPAYALGRNPDERVMAVSYSASLAANNARQVQRLMRDNAYASLFPRTRLAGGKESASKGYVGRADEFEVVGHRGGYIALGTSGSATGRGSSVMILDDLVKSRAEADSQTYRDRVYDWFTGTIYNRLEKNGRCLLVMTRWHADDAASRLLAHAKANPDADQWEVLSLPAVCETGSKHPEDPRNEGEVLWPNKYSSARMASMKATMGARDWLSLYQQRPVAAGGNIVQRGWFRSYRPAELPLRFERVLISADLTFDGGKKGDWCVALVVGKHQGRAYVLDMVRRQMPFTQQVAAIRSLYERTREKWGCREVLIEKAANGFALVDVLASQIPSIVAIPVGQASKLSRAESVTPIIEAGNLWLPHEHDAGWVDHFITEWCAFPQGAHDDCVDATSQALNRMFPARASMIGAVPMGVQKAATPSFC